MPYGKSAVAAPYNTHRQFEHYLQKSVGSEPQAPAGHELLFSRNLFFNRGTSLDFKARPWTWVWRQISRLRARSEVAKLIDAHFGDYNTIVTKRRFFPNETLGDRLMKDCATASGFSFNRIDEAALQRIARRIAAIHTALEATPPAYDGSSPFKIAKFWQGRRTLQISGDDLRKLYSKAESPVAPSIPQAEVLHGSATIAVGIAEPTISGGAGLSCTNVLRKPDVDEDYRRGLFYSDRRNAEYDLYKALCCFVRAGQQGDLMAPEKIKEILERSRRVNNDMMFELYKIYRDGPDGVMRDPKEACRCLKACRSEHAHAELARLAREGDPGLQYSLYEHDRDGITFHAWNSYVKGVQWLLRAARQGHEGALKELDRLKREGDLALRFTVSELYREGLDPVDVDEAEANSWYRGADLPELRQTLVELGRAFERKGTDEDKQIAIDYYIRAIEQSDKRDRFGAPKGLKELGWLVGNGPASLQYRVAQTYEEWREKRPIHIENAIRWYKRAADDGHAKAQYRLFRAYRDGDGVDQDHQQAAKLLVRAAQKRNYEALTALQRLAGSGSAAMQLAMARTYNNREDRVQLRRLLAGEDVQFKGVAPSMAEAAAWHARAAEQKDEAALLALKEIANGNARELQKALGEVYRDGTAGVQVDPVEASKWFSLAGVQTAGAVTTADNQVRGLDEDD